MASRPGSTPHRTPARDGHVPLGVVLHSTSGTFAGTIDWFARPSSRVSAHHVVALDGRVVTLVDEADTARHAGRKARSAVQFVRGIRNPNLVSIGIEFEDGGDPEGVERPDAQYAAGAGLLRAIARRWSIPLDREHVVGHREIREDTTCPGNLDIARLLREAGAHAQDGGIVCLFPVRNGERDLPGYLAAAPAWCDAIVALDDGSTDATRAILDADPLVRTVLTNPPRDTAAGWDDGENRARLLASAAELAPAWIVSVDADERIPSADAATLRAFLATDALPGVAYGLEHVRLWGADRADPERIWVYRVFAFDPAHRFPTERLHFNPVPTVIERGAWVRTTIRVLHDGSRDEERLAERRRRYEEADPDGEYPTSFGGLDARPTRTVPVAERDATTPVIAPIADQLGLRPLFSASEPPPPGADDRGSGDDGDDREGGGVRPLLAVLLPVRNGAEELPGWFASIRPIADAVIALDDGSTDATRELLAADPLVERILARPKRPDYVEWDDAGNRSALLRAADELRPRWILWLDADERLDPGDAAALRAFLEPGADPAAGPGTAYGLTVHRMIGDREHWDRADLVAYRLFAWEPGLRLPDGRLHEPPVPVSIPHERYVPTTLRIQHLASLTPARRRARFEKYREADPGAAFQPDYGNLLAEPGTLHRWETRPAGLPVVPTAVRPVDEDDELELAIVGVDLDAPALSAIVISRDDEDVIETAVGAVVGQDVPEPFEVIVVTSGTDRTAEIVRERFPDVILVELARPALPGQARNAGLAVARGDYVSFPGSHVVIEPGSLAARLRAHRLGYPMVTGTTVNLTDTPAGWASYFLDHAAVIPGRPSGELDSPPAHCSYDRGFLEELGGFPEDLRAGEDTVVNLRMAAEGRHAYRDAEIRLGHRTPCTTPGRLLAHHFRRGRGLGRILLDAGGGAVLTRDTIDRMLVRYLPRRLGGIGRCVRRWADDELAARYRSARPLIALGAAAALVGTWTELLRPRSGKLRRLFGVPAVHVAIGGLDARDTHPVGRTDVLLLARIEPVAGRVRLLSLPRDLLVDVPGYGPARLNEAYFVGAIGSGAATASGNGVRPPDLSGGARPRSGMRMLARTLERVVYARVDGTVLVDFDGFRSLVDALGGVEVEVPHAIDDDFVGEDGRRFSAHFTRGSHRLDGEEALTYARTRKADGDAFRRERHLDLIRATLRAARGVRSFTRAARVIVAGARAVRTDLGVVRGALALIGVLRAGRDGIEGVQLAPPVVRSVRTDTGKWVHRGDELEIAEFAHRRWIGRDRGTAPGDGRDAPIDPAGSSESGTRVR